MSACGSSFKRAHSSQFKTLHAFILDNQLVISQIAMSEILSYFLCLLQAVSISGTSYEL